MQRSKKVAIFDVCGTLTEVNNTYCYIYFVSKKKPFKLLLFYFYFALLDFFSLINYRVDFFRLKVISLLNGYSEIDLKEYADDYVIELVKKNKINMSLVKKLMEFKKKHYEVILLSASINLPIEALANYLKVDSAISSHLRFEHGVCTGQLENDYLLEKKNYIEKSILSRFDKKDVFFYSDNIEDRDIVLLLDNGFAIFHSKREYSELKKIIPIKKILEYKGNYSTNHDLPTIKNNTLFLYIPMFYYFLSRPLSLFSVFIKEILPFLFVFLLYKDLSIETTFLRSTFLLFIVYFLIYSFYEIGILYNDYFAVKNERNPTLRIAKEVKINFSLFIAIRVFFVLLVLFLLKINIYIIILSFLTLLILFIHSIIDKKYRTYSFIILRFMKLFIPSFFLFKSFVIPFSVVFLTQQLQSILLYYGKISKVPFTGSFKQYAFFSFFILLSVFISGYVYLIPIMLIYFFLNYIMFLQYRFGI